MVIEYWSRVYERCSVENHVTFFVEGNLIIFHVIQLEIFVVVLQCNDWVIIATIFCVDQIGSIIESIEAIKCIIRKHNRLWETNMKWKDNVLTSKYYKIRKFTKAGERFSYTKVVHRWKTSSNKLLVIRAWHHDTL